MRWGSVSTFQFSGVWFAAMRKLFYFTFCTTGMIAFWYFIRFMVTGISERFGDGFFCGIMLIVILMWLIERMGLIKVVERDKGVWIPKDPSLPRFGSDSEF